MKLNPFPPSSVSRLRAIGLVGCISGVGMLTLAPAQAQTLQITDGFTTLENTRIFVPNSAQPDNRALIYDGNVRPNSTFIRTNQGDLPVNVLFEPSVIPTLDNVVNRAPGVGDTGSILGTVSFRGFSAIGEPAFFNNLPTTVNYTVTGIAPVNQGALVEYETRPFILTETGTAASASANGSVQRDTAVVLVQYQAGPPTDQFVLGNFVPASDYVFSNPGQRYDSATINLTLNSGTVDVPNPPGFSDRPSSTSGITSVITVGTPQTIFVPDFSVPDFVFTGFTGFSQNFPILPNTFVTGVFVFVSVPTGGWYDPPMAAGFEFEMQPNPAPLGINSRIFPGLVGAVSTKPSLFTAISGFPRDIDADDRFTVAVGDVVLGEFGPGDTLDFGDYADQLGDLLVDGAGVAAFVISGIDPTVDAADPTAFPLKLDFNTETASFDMRAIETEAMLNDDYDPMADLDYLGTMPLETSLATTAPPEPAD